MPRQPAGLSSPHCACPAGPPLGRGHPCPYAGLGRGRALVLAARGSSPRKRLSCVPRDARCWEQARGTLPPCSAQHRDRDNDMLPLAEVHLRSSQGLAPRKTSRHSAPRVWTRADGHLQDAQSSPMARAWASGKAWDVVGLALALESSWSLENRIGAAPSPVVLALHNNPPIPAGRGGGTCLLPKQRRENCKHRGHPALPIIALSLTAPRLGLTWTWLELGALSD